MKRALLVLLGVLLLLLGLALAAAGASVAAVVGSDDTLSTAPAHLSGQGVALVAEDITVDESNLPVPTSVGTLTLQVSDPAGGTMFVGTASPKDVDRYLTGAPYDVVVDMTSGATGSTRPVPGTQQPQSPTSQTFWTSQATGAPARLTATISPTSTVVIMNADAAKKVDADVVVTFTVKHAFVGSLVAAGVGVLLVILAIITFWRARVAGRRAREAAAAAALPVAAPAAATVLPGAAAADAPPTPAAADTAVVAASDATTVAPVAAVEVPPADGPPLATTPIADPSFAPPDDAAPAATEPASPVEVAPTAPVAASDAASATAVLPAVDAGAPTTVAPAAGASAAAVAGVAGAAALAASAGREPQAAEPASPAEQAVGAPETASPSAAEPPVTVPGSQSPSAPEQPATASAPEATSAPEPTTAQTPEGVEIASAAGTDVEPSVAVPAWAGSGGPDTLTGDELAAPPRGGAVTGGFADDAAQAAAVAGDTGAIAPVTAAASPAEAPADAPAAGSAAETPAAQPHAGEPAPSTPPAAPVTAPAPAAPSQGDAADDQDGPATEPFERVDAPLYDELASWFRDDADGGSSAEH